MQARIARKKPATGAACCWGVPGVRPANVAVLGGGMVGSNAIFIALEMGANVAVLDIVEDQP